MLGVQCSHELSVNKMLSLAFLRFWNTPLHQQADSFRKQFKHVIKSAAAANQSRPVFNGTMDANTFSNTYKEHWHNAMAGESPVHLSVNDKVMIMAVREGLGCRVTKGRATRN